MMQEIIRLDSYIKKTFDNDCVLKDIHATLEKEKNSWIFRDKWRRASNKIKILTGHLFPSSGGAYI